MKCRCKKEERKLGAGSYMLHMYKLAEDTTYDKTTDIFATRRMRECKTKWQWCPTKKHVIADCQHGIKAILDE